MSQYVLLMYYLKKHELLGNAMEHRYYSKLIMAYSHKSVKTSLGLGLA